MVREAEQYKAEDEKNKDRVEAKNHLENYAYSLRNTVRDEKIAGKLDAGDKDKLNAAIDDAVSWMDKNQQAGKDEFEAKQKELEGVAMPIMTKLYQQGGMPGGPGMPGGFPGQDQPGPGASSGPKVEEVD